MARRASSASRVINKLARDDYAIIHTEDRVFFRAVYDHFTRLHYFIESTRDLVSGALEIYLSAFARRLALSASQRAYRLPMAHRVDVTDAIGAG